MASALSAGAQAAIRYSIAILGRAPTETELNSFAAAYKGASATASEDAVAAAVVASTAGTSALRPGVFSATKQAQVILGNHGVTNADVVSYVASMIDGTNADAGKVALPLGTVARVVANFFSNWTSTPSNPYNDVFMAGGTALKNASTAAEAAIVGGSGGAAPTTPTFTLTASESVDEGKSTIVTLATKNVASGETINYIISGTGIDENDVTALTGSATVGLDGKAYITVRALADKTTEGTETMTIMVGSATASIKINDLSLDQGKSITLTTAANSGPDFAGGSADDMFNGVIAGAASTLNSGDNLDGGAGNDTLSVAISGTNAAAPSNTAAFVTKNIENVMVSNYETSALDDVVDLAGATGLVKVGVSGSSATGGTQFATVLNKVDIDLSNMLGTLIVNYPTATVGAADTQKVALANVGQSGTATNVAALTVNGVETYELTASSKSALAALAGGTSLSTVKIGGAGNMTITGALEASVKVVDGSASTGGISVRMNNAAMNVSVVGGSGNDVIRTGTDLTVNDTISGGDGTDTLIVDEGADVVANLKVTGFETLRVIETTGTVNMTHLAGITAVDVRFPAASSASAATVNNAPAGATLRLSSDAGAIEYNIKDANTLAATADSLAVTLNTGSTTPSDVDVRSLKVNGVETLSISSVGAPLTDPTAGEDTNSILILQDPGTANATLTGVTITGSSNLALGTLPLSEKLTTINAADFTGALTVVNASTNPTARTTITGGSGNDFLTGRASTTTYSGSDSILGGAGDDTLVGNSGADYLSGGDGNDQITGTSLSATLLSTGNDTILGGDGADTINSGTGSDNIDAGAGNDVIQFSLTALTSADTVDGGDGNDSLSFQQTLTAATTLDLSSATNTTFTNVKNIEQLVLNPTGAALTVTLGDVAMASFNNAVTLTTVAGSTAVSVDAGAVLSPSSSVTFTGVRSLASTYTIGNNKDIVTFSTADDFLRLVSPTFLQATDSISGGDGNDTLQIANSATTDVAITAAQLGAISSFEAFTVDSSGDGETRNVSITLSEAVAIANANTTDGILTIRRDSSDTGRLTVNASSLATRSVAVTGGNGNDSLVGGALNDTLNGGQGIDTVLGGAGNDLFNINTSPSSEIAYGESYDGGDGTDEIRIAGGTSASVTALSGVTITGVEYVTVTAPTINTNYDVSMRADAGYSFAFGNSFAITASSTESLGNVRLSVDFLGATTVNLSGITSLGAGNAGTLGSTFTNTLQTGYANYTLTGLADTFRGSTNAITGGNDNVTYNLNGGAGNDTLEGGGGADVINGGSGDDTIYMDMTDIGNDRITTRNARGDSDTLIGGGGSDTIIFGVRNTAPGDSGTSVAADTADVNGGFTIDLSSGTDQVSVADGVANPAPQTGFVNVNVSAIQTIGAIITASSLGSVITGSSLVDTITGGVGADRLIMGVSATALLEDSASGGAGIDTLVILGTDGIASNTTVNLGSSIDQISVGGVAGAATTGFENVDLSGYTGNAGFTTLVTAFSGGSQIAGSVGKDSITGGIGNDTIYGFTSTDTVDGAGGTADTLVITSYTTALTTPFNANNSAFPVSTTSDAQIVNIENITIRGDTLITVNFALQTESLNISATGVVKQYPGAGVSEATGSLSLTAGSGADTITGSSLADTIVGGAGADTINSGSGNDNVTGGTGADIINVGAGTDVVVLAAGDSGTAAFTNGGASAAAIDAGDYWTLTGADVYTGLATGETLTLPGPQAAAAVAVSGTSGLITGSALGDYAVVTGTWDSTTGRFAYSATGTDSLVLYDNDGTGAGTLIEALVLVGSATLPNIG